MKVVIAGNHREFLQWCRDTGTPPSAAVYLDHERKLLGLELAEEDLVFTGRYWLSPIDPLLLRSRIRR